jgi:hypothetical protein
MSDVLEGPVTETLFDESGAPVRDLAPGRHRRDDHATSLEGARSVSYRAGSQKARLLEAYRMAFVNGWGGLTDEQAAGIVGLERACYWKRCGELRADGRIVPTGEERRGEAGVMRIVCRYTGDTG